MDWHCSSMLSGDAMPPTAQREGSGMHFPDLNRSKVHMTIMTADLHEFSSQSFDQGFSFSDCLWLMTSDHIDVVSSCDRGYIHTILPAYTNQVSMKFSWQCCHCFNVALESQLRWFFWLQTRTWLGEVTKSAPPLPEPGLDNAMETNEAMSWEAWVVLGGGFQIQKWGPEMFTMNYFINL